ncbi:MAG: carbohydrate ABC transporter permease [Clostridiales bacterium]|nr:carbohydrate ABC transporter permease [Clostridiales bacterium]
MVNTQKWQGSRIFFNLMAIAIISVVSVISVIPFIMVISGSFSDNSAIIRDGYSLLPREANLDAYRMIFLFPKEVARSYLISTTVTVSGTLGGLVIMTMAGYALQRKDLKYRNQLAFFFYFTTLFSGGLVPWYMVVSALGMRETLWALIVPMMCSSFYILLIRNFIRTIPDSLTESAKIDGGGDLYILIRIIIPLAKPILATVGLFLALAYWNDWYLTSLFVRKNTNWPLQFRLYFILSNQIAISTGGAEHFVGRSLPTEAVKLANAVISTGPIILLYPFLQKYFVQGITIGAVKG